MFKTFISVEQLHAIQNAPNVVIVDTCYQLNDKDAGRQMYRTKHIAGAVYAHPLHDLSGPPLTDCGRHPLPSEQQLREVFSGLGICQRTQVVAYDNRGISAARLWWLLNYMGHNQVAVLDGGIQAWNEAGYPTESGTGQNASATFTGTADRRMLVVYDEVLQQRLLIDSRDAERFQGRSAGSDATAGHIPGAKNRPHARNKDQSFKLRDPGILRREFKELLGDVPPEETTFYCGSGVSACHNLLTMAHLGMKLGKLYAGSWSEWSQFE